MRYNACFISDIHLGSNHSNVDAFLCFLKNNDFETIYLCGDIFDFLVIKKSFFWSESFNTVIQKLLRKARHGTKIIYIPGNHDALLRKFDNHSFGNITILNEAVHFSKKFKKIKIIHGDEFDLFFKGKELLYFIGSKLYGISLFLDKFLRKFVKSFSLSFFLKRKIKGQFEKFVNYYNSVKSFAIENEVDGIISGHTHLPDLKYIDNLLIGNCGCWIADTINTCIVETLDGDFILLKINSKGESINEKILTNNR